MGQLSRNITQAVGDVGLDGEGIFWNEETTELSVVSIMVILKAVELEESIPSTVL